MEINQQLKFVFKEPYSTQEGTIPQGSEIIIFRNTVYLNGGMIHPAYQKILRNIIDDKAMREKYLKQLPIIHNKV